MKSLAWSDVIVRKRHASSDWLNNRTHERVCKMCGKMAMMTGAQKYCDECQPMYYKMRSHEATKLRKVADDIKRAQQMEAEGRTCIQCGRRFLSKKPAGEFSAWCSFTCKELHRQAQEKDKRRCQSKTT